MYPAPIQPINKLRIFCLLGISIFNRDLATEKHPLQAEAVMYGHRWFLQRQEAAIQTSLYRVVLRQ